MKEIDLQAKPVINLNWDAPTKREDDSALDQTVTYNIYWGTQPGDYQNTIEVSGSSQSLDFNNLPLPFYMVMTSVDADDRESKYSPEVVFVKKMYPPKPPTNIRVGGNG